MDTVATLSATERAELFQETATKRGVATQIIEKDFWVCWTLRRLFELSEIGEHLIFKGGTTLSKIFNVIERFSEDIDISIDRAYLGFDKSEDPEHIQGTNKRRRQLEALKDACETKIRNQLLPSLNDSFIHKLDRSGENIDLSWQLTQDSIDSQTLLFAYPTVERSLKLLGLTYIRPVVRIELGARSDHWPWGIHSITPYAAEDFPGFFKEPSCEIKVLEAERTFWEKATLLHAEYYRPKDRTTPERLSRHYYDLYKLMQAKISNQAIEKIELLDRVVDHKKIFFQQNRANYDQACKGDIHLSPPEFRLSDLRVDYEKMREMFFGLIPPFDEIIAKMTELELQINSATSKRVLPDE